MKKILLFVIMLAIGASAQFKKDPFDKPDIKEGLFNKEKGGDFFSNLFNSENFSMHHSFNASYSTFGQYGLATTTYTNSMFYKFSDNLNIRLDASLVYSPYNSLGKTFQDNINGLYISRAELNFKPWENTVVRIQYRNIPAGMYSGYYGGYGNPFYGYSNPWGSYYHSYDDWFGY
ncbi:MAG: hypothetical protein LC102_02390 [Ignavibacteriales bacterium]|jgi:hypothetical protein|nr:MAG: hypothetical protein F9K26_01710 [Ignavibacteriaceae bacterium]MBW7872154.1 hypothetical protein [Ignavibacteria bacterium]MCZ2142262.1 hypothetical protein [Ignavibacteriales bacterium]OQY78808.1 MAG: hypothetical protein B6D45_01830 [Ignavibacteriales bacterium UTCHB3]MBV6445701.1 hypothetical protein [Ignavibacteriaceae bacterium]